MVKALSTAAPGTSRLCHAVKGDCAAAALVIQCYTVGSTEPPRTTADHAPADVHIRATPSWDGTTRWPTADLWCVSLPCVSDL